jgi:hypothetical protein
MSSGYWKTLSCPFFPFYLAVLKITGFVGIFPVNAIAEQEVVGFTYWQVGGFCFHAPCLQNVIYFVQI